MPSNPPFASSYRLLGGGNAHLAQNPDARIISLGIGDTTEPIPGVIAGAMEEAARALGHAGGVQRVRGGAGAGGAAGGAGQHVLPGAGREGQRDLCVGRRQVRHQPAAAHVWPRAERGGAGPLLPGLRGQQRHAGPDGRVRHQPRSSTRNIVYMTCKPENNFFPDLAATPRTDIIFFCSPNNPTGQHPPQAQVPRSGHEETFAPPEF